jgi:hypothetical protein
VEKYGEAEQAIDDNVAHTHWIATNTHSDNVMITEFQQHLLDEVAAMLSFTYSVLLLVKLAIWRENT